MFAGAPFVLRPKLLPSASTAVSPFSGVWQRSSSALAGVGLSPGVIAPYTSSTGEDPLTGIINYYLGDDRRLWHEGLRTYAAVRSAIHPDVDVIRARTEMGDHYRIEIRPGVDPGSVFLTFDSEVGIAADGALVARPASGAPVSWGLPRLTQGTVPLPARWKVVGWNQATIVAEARDASREVDLELERNELVPSADISSSMFRGGTAVAVDREEAVYIAGQAATHGRGVGIPGSLIVQKFDANGTLIYTTYIGGSTNDSPHFALQPDSAGNVWVAGVSGARFPVTAGAPCLHDCEGIFTLQLGKKGELLQSRMTNGLRNVLAVSVDSHGVTAVAGRDSRFTSVRGMPARPDDDQYVARIESGGVTWGTHLPGLEPIVVALMPQGTIVVGGMATDTRAPAFFPRTIPGYQRTRPGGTSDGFLLLLDPSKTGMESERGATFLGGVGGDPGFDHEAVVAITNDSAGNIIAAGYTSGGFPSRFSAGPGGGKDVFVARLSSDLSTLKNAFVLGGSKDDFVSGLSVDRNGNVWVTGSTASSNFPRLKAITEVDSGPHLFAAEVDSAGTSLILSTYAGRADRLPAVGIVANAAGGAFVAVHGDAIAAPAGAGSIETNSSLVLLRFDRCEASAALDGQSTTATLPAALPSPREKWNRNLLAAAAATGVIVIGVAIALLRRREGR